MKKNLAKILSAVMVALMLLSLLPISAFAANMSWTFTATVIGGYYSRNDGTVSTTNRYNWNRHLSNDAEHEVGYKFEWDSTAGGDTYSGGWQLCWTVDGNVAERVRAYIYDRDMSNASGSWTTPSSSHTGNSTHSFTIYLSSFPKADYSKYVTLTYDANGGENAPAAEKKLRNADGTRFTTSSVVPTYEGHDFAGWADTPNAEEAQYKAGDPITITANKTIYAVWNEHVHVDENDDGFCDECNACMHPHNDNGYCTVDGCTHEGDCCANHEHSHVDADEEGFCDDENCQACLHPKDDDGYCLIENCNHTGDCCPRRKMTKPGMTKSADKDTVAAGEKVTFTLKSNVPDYLYKFLPAVTVDDPTIISILSANNYYLVFHDNMDERLIFNNDVVITVNGKALAANLYTVTPDTEDGCAFHITLDLIAIFNAGEYFTRDDIANAPEIIVTYSANLAEDITAGTYKNSAYVAFEEEESAKSDVTVDVYAVEIFKYDQVNSMTGLAGAVFELKDLEGNLIRGNIVSGADGYVTIDGLAAGKYVLVEVTAPEGYLKSDKALEVTLEGATHTVHVRFANAPIPHTGGNGTMIFTVSGIAIIGAALAMLVIARKKSKEN